MTARIGPSLAVLFLVNVFNFYDRQVFGAVLEPLRREFHLSDTQLGALPTVFTVLYAVAGVPLGRLADRWSRKRLLAGGVAVWAVLTGLGGLSVNYIMLIATRLGVGIGEAVCAPTAASWIGDLVPVARRARAMAFFMIGVPVGIMVSFAVSGPVAQAFGWRVAMAVAAVPAALIVPAILILQEPARTAAPLPCGRGSESALRTLARIPALWWIAISGAVLNFILYSFSTFISAFLTRYHGLSVSEAGVWSGLGSGAAGILGALIAGQMGDRMDRLRFSAIASLAAAPVGFAAIRLPSGNTSTAILLLMIAYGLLQMYYGPVYAAIQDIVPAEMRGTAMAAYFLVMYLCGGALGPLLTGGLSDYLARRASAAGTAGAEAARAAGLHDAMFIIPLLSVVLAVILWAGSRAVAIQVRRTA